MLNNYRILALVIARGGSKGLPGKNIRMLNGKPLIAWTIESARSSRYIDKVVVSTEDMDIARISLEYGIDEVIDRPTLLAADSAKSVDVVLHTVDLYEARKDRFDVLILLQPTSPLRTEVHIDNALDFFAQKEASAVVSVAESEHSPLWMNSLPSDLNMKDFISSKHSSLNRQELDKYYRLNGAIYIARWPFFKKNKDWYSDSTYAYIMDRKSSIDIDSEEDFLLTECILKKAGI